MLLNWLLYLLILTFGLGQFAAIFTLGDTKIYLFDLVLGFFVLIGVFYFLLVRKRLFLPKRVWVFLAFSLFALLTLVVRAPFLSISEIFASAAYLLRFFGYLFCALIVYNLLFQELLSDRALIWSILGLALFISLAGFIQLSILPDFTALATSLGWDPHKNRLASTFFDPNFTGGFLALTLAFLFEKLSGKQKYLLLPILLALVLTFSRSSWAMLAVIIFVYGVWKYRKLLILAFFIAFLAYFAVPRIQTRLIGITDPADSAHFRLISWKNALTIAKDNLLLGVGFNTFRYAQKEYGFFEAGKLGGHSGAGADSSFLLVLATTGVAGVVLFLGGYTGALVEAHCSAPLYNAHLPLMASLLGLCVHAQFVNSLFYPQIMFLWLIIIMVG